MGRVALVIRSIPIRRNITRNYTFIIAHPELFGKEIFHSRAGGGERHLEERRGIRREKRSVS